MEKDLNWKLKIIQLKPLVGGTYVLIGFIYVFCSNVNLIINQRTIFISIHPTSTLVSISKWICSGGK